MNIGLIKFYRPNILVESILDKYKRTEKNNCKGIINLMITKEKVENLKQKLEYYKSLDIKDIKLEKLKDIRDVKIDTTKPVIERICSFLVQMDGNPYIFKVGDTLVKVCFNEDGPSLQECLVNMFAGHQPINFYK